MSDPIKRLIWLRSFVCVVVTALLVAPLLLPGTADARVRSRGSGHGDTAGDSTSHFGNLPDGGSAPPPRYELALVDEESGVGVAVLDIGGSGGEKTFLGESLAVVGGKDALHVEGECPACDELRGMYSNGDLSALYCASIVPEKADMPMVSYVIPLEGMSDAVVYQCVDGELVTKECEIRDNAAWFASTAQTPFGIRSEGAEASTAQESASAEDAATTSNKPMIVIPEDDDEDENVVEGGESEDSEGEEALLSEGDDNDAGSLSGERQVLLFPLGAIAVVAVVIVAAYILLDPKRGSKK